MSGFGTLTATWMVADSPAPATRGVVLEQTRALDKFLAEIERRAFRMAQMALRDPDDAMDVVQDAMLKLARNYATRPSEEWRPLFYRILENGVRDLQRRRTVRKRFMTWLPGRRRIPTTRLRTRWTTSQTTRPRSPTS
jgi:DNA-directed RNA polymerase specialized sigma24 family protein